MIHSEGDFIWNSACAVIRAHRMIQFTPTLVFIDMAMDIVAVSGF